MTEIERRLEADLVTATRAKSPELTVIRSLKSAIHNEHIAKKTNTLVDEDVVSVLRRELKRRLEAAELYDKGGRPELAAKERDEANFISRFLPVSPETEEIVKTMRQIINELGLQGQQSIGPLVKATVAHFKGAVDGKTASQLAKEILNHP